MARQPRFYLPGVPQHIVQCGNNRLPCFLDEADRARHLHLLGEALLATGCSLHACVLMDNHVHLLATPPDVGAVARFTQKLGRHSVGQFNARHRRSGTLWEGRYKACLVDSADYLLRCAVRPAPRSVADLAPRTTCAGCHRSRRRLRLPSAAGRSDKRKGARRHSRLPAATACRRE
jgi:REP element-mobilizing transposase RayT